MSKLLQRLSDPAKSGVYRAGAKDAILEAVKGSGLRLAQIALAPRAGKAQVIAQLAQAMEFPSWFGGNWDALEDCLTDLSWSKAEGHVLLIEGGAQANPDDMGVLEDILAAAAAFWAGRKRPFFAVIVGGSSALAPLYRDHI